MVVVVQVLGLARALTVPSTEIEGRSIVTGIDSVIGAVHSRLRLEGSDNIIPVYSRSVFGTRRDGGYGSGSRTASFYEDNFAFPDSPEPIRRSRVGTGNPSATRFLKKRPKHRRKKHQRKPPKIFLTKLPLSQLQDPEIFFTKIIKENGSSIEILPSDLKPSDLKGFHNSPSLMFEEIRVYKDDDKMTIEELPEENGSVIRSNLIYQDGLRNVNSMIYNSQTVDQKLSKTDKTKGYAMESSTLYPHLESVSSTAMVKQEKGDMPNFSSIEETTHEEESLQVASLQVGWWREDNWVLPILILASATLILLLVFQVLHIHLKRGKYPNNHALLSPPMPPPPRCSSSSDLSGAEGTASEHP